MSSHCSDQTSYHVTKSASLGISVAVQQTFCKIFEISMYMRSYLYQSFSTLTSVEHRPPSHLFGQPNPLPEQARRQLNWNGGGGHG